MSATSGHLDLSEKNDKAAKKQNRLNKIKNFAILGLVIIIIILAIKIGLSSDNNNDINHESGSSEPSFGRPLVPNGSLGKVCMTSNCVSAANRLFEQMNLSADPCQDFNQFACGKFHAEFVLPEDKSSWSAFTPLTEIILQKGRLILEEDEVKNEWPVVKKAKIFYKSCMDEEKLEEIGVKPIIDRLQMLGGWPLLEGPNWSEQDYEWHKQMARNAREGFGKDYIIKVSTGIDDRNSSFRVIYADQPSLGLQREYLIKGFEDKDVQSYFTYMKESAVLLGAAPAKAEEELEASLRFELELAEISAPREERRNSSKLYNPKVLGEMESLPGHPPTWTGYVKDIIFNVHDIDESERIIVRNPVFLQKMSGLINKTPKRVIANYIGWRITKSVMSSLNQAALDIKLKYDKAILGKNALPPRWKKCVEEVGFDNYDDNNFRIVAASLYVKKHFPQEAKAEMLEMIDYLRKSFQDILNNLEWMDDLTKERARKKLDHIGAFIGYPDEMLDQDILEEYHQGIEIDEQDYFENKINLSRWSRRKTFGKLRGTVDKKDWTHHSLVALVNAFYNPSLNSIEFPAGILQGVFFDHKVPKYLNYGAIGAVIGHEITHGFDDSGRQYDYEGNLADWWEPDTKDKFIEKTKCIINQYGQYRSEQIGMNLNGVTTQGENIADNGGTKEALMAYSDWVKDHSEELQLPGLTLSPRQLFWVSWGQVWCTKYRDASMKSQIKTGAHSPGLFRIIGPLSNSPEFAKDFNCPRSSGMNPDEKCEVW